MVRVEKVEKVEKVEIAPFNPVKSRGGRVEKVESPLGLNLSTLPDDPQPVRVSDLLRSTFGGSVVHWTNGHRSGGTRPDWLDWPGHTAAEMVTASGRDEVCSRKLNNTKGGRR